MATFKGRALVYSIVGCPHCVRVKNLLTNLGVPFVEVSLDKHSSDVRREVKRRAGKLIVPLIYFNEMLIGGVMDMDRIANCPEELDKLVTKIREEEPPRDAPFPPDEDTALDDLRVGEIMCDVDEYAQIVNEIKLSGIIKGHWRRLTYHKNTFTGKDFVSWIMAKKRVDNYSAVEMGQKILSRNFGHTTQKREIRFVDDDTLYRLLDDEESNALNAGSYSDCLPREAGELSEDIRNIILMLLAENTDSEGRNVNYLGISQSPEFETYTRLTRELQRIDLLEASEETRLSFFINIYNALVIHAIIIRGPPVNLWQRYKFFNTVRYIIGAQSFSLQEIENGILRANRRGVGMISKPFARNDERIPLCLREAEPMVHFALVCGSRSCPPIKTYTADGIQEELRLATAAFLDGDTALLIRPDRKQLKLSMIFKWYKSDFGTDTVETICWIINHMNSDTKRNALDEMLTKHGKDIKITYMKYDWTVNAA